MEPKRIGILVVAYNAASTLAQVLDRIPVDFRDQITKVLVGDDASQDSTHLVALGYQQVTQDLPIEVMRHTANLGYGGNQKAGYRWAIENDLDIVVLLHGDGQYAPELLPEIVAPLERGEADAVFGSRMLDTGGARRGGMPATSSSATGSSPPSRTPSWAPPSPSGTRATGPTRWRPSGTSPSTATTTASTSTPR